MKRLVLLFVLMTTPVMAKPLTLTMEEQDFVIMIQLLLRSTQSQQSVDWQVTEAALAFKKRIEDAAKAANEPPKEPVK